MLGVPAELVEEHGVVSAECARAMARGVRRRLDATWGVATTGVAGPDSQEGQPVGTVWVAVAGPDACGRAAAVARRRPAGDPGGARCEAARVRSCEASCGKNRASGSVGQTTSATPQSKDQRMVLFRRLLGDVLRSARMQRGMTLREVSAEARVSLGYISEIERGQKEASSELLASLCEAMDLPLSDVLREVADAVAIEERARDRGAARRSRPARPPRRRRRLRRLTRAGGSALGLAARAPVLRALAAGVAQHVTGIGVPQRRHGDVSRR